MFVRVCTWPLPYFVGGRVRVLVFRLASFQIGPKCVMYRTPTVTGNRGLYRNLKIGESCRFNMGCFFDLTGSITLGDQVDFGHQVIVLTASHHFGPKERRSGEKYVKSVEIGNGTWVGARVVKDSEAVVSFFDRPV